jgi:hypothetical protein
MVHSNYSKRARDQKYDLWMDTAPDLMEARTAWPSQKEASCLWSTSWSRRLNAYLFQQALVPCWCFHLHVSACKYPCQVRSEFNCVGQRLLQEISSLSQLFMTLGTSHSSSGFIFLPMVGDELRLQHFPCMPGDSFCIFSYSHEDTSA